MTRRRFATTPSLVDRSMLYLVRQCFCTWCGFSHTAVHVNSCLPGTEVHRPPKTCLQHEHYAFIWRVDVLEYCTSTRVVVSERPSSRSFTPDLFRVRVRVSTTSLSIGRTTFAPVLFLWQQKTTFDHRNPHGWQVSL